jgi:ankyrin repeat protein
MKRLALTAMVICLCLVPLGAQVADRRLEKAVERIEKNDADGLRRLLAQDPSLVRRTAAGVLPHWRWTLLHVATTGKAPLGVVSVLVDAGSDVNAQDNEGNTPLHFSVKRINRENFPKQDYDGIIRLLLDKKGDVHIVNLGGMSPLHTAVAFKADPSAVEMLIQAGADVNLKTLANFDGWTPLHGAAARGSADVITVLLKHGADPAATDGKGMTALQVAERGGFADAAKVLRAAARGDSIIEPLKGR